MNSIEFANAKKEEFIARRRDFHRHPEPAWLEYRTAAFVAELLEKWGFDVSYGESVLHLDSRMGLPSQEVMKAAMDRAIAEGANPTWVERLGYGQTAVVGTMKFTEDGPTVAFRADMDANDVIESTETDHFPVQNNFASTHPEAMHACGHDAHTTMLLGLAEYVAFHRAEYKGTLKLIFQPAEEGVRGAKAMADAGVVDDVDIFFGLHIGIDSALAGALACMDPGFLATTKLDAHFKGYSAHAGASPELGHNAMLAACTAVLNLQGISRHSKGASRINVGVLQSGTGRNVIPDSAVIKIETRGATTEINTYIHQRALQIIKGAALMHEVNVSIEETGSAPASVNSEALAHSVKTVAENLALFQRVDLSYEGGGSEDCAYFLQKVINHGGQATYMILGSQLAAPHHNPRFNIQEEDMIHGIALLGALVNSHLK